MQEGQKGQGFNCVFDVLCLKRGPKRTQQNVEIAHR